MANAQSANCHFYDTVEARRTETRRAPAKQDWSVGAIVTVGFVRGLTVIAKDAAGYSLTKGGKSYRYTPHHGLRAA